MKMEWIVSSADGYSILPDNFWAKYGNCRIFFLYRNLEICTMEFLTSTILIILLVVTIIALIAVIIYLNVAFYKEKKDFKVRIQTLQYIIAEITNQNSARQGQIELADQMEQTLKSVKTTLNEDVFGLQYEMFDLLSKNNLLKK